MVKGIFICRNIENRIYTVVCSVSTRDYVLISRGDSVVLRLFTAVT